MKHSANLCWEKPANESFIDGKYSRVHKWYFDGGAVVPASSSPEIIPVPMSDESAIDPEESFIASLSACHMLFFLSIAAVKKYVIEKYEDYAEGSMDKDDKGKMCMIKVTLHPKIIFSGSVIPSRQQVNELHELSHARCYLANSVKCKIEIVSE
jgi:organic hydroperoxide reductase OsmC/OhrA